MIKKLLFLLVLLLTAATGAVAQTTYKVSVKEGTKDAKNWSIASGEKSAKGDAADGLKGLSEGDQVTIQYNGRLKVKGVKAKPDLLSGVFSVSSTKKVNFSKGNLRYASSKWSFFDNQYDFYNSYSADAWDKFGWSTSTTTYGMNTSTSNSNYSGDFVDWGATMGTGWFTLSSAEWTYLFKTRSASTVGGTDNGRYAKAKVNNVGGVILFPDTYTHPDGVTAPNNVNTANVSFDSNSYTVADWTKMETAGCVFLPAAGYRSYSSVGSAGTNGYYWSATPYNAENAYLVSLGNLNPAGTNLRYFGVNVRLVQEATSDAPAAKPAATVTTAPTGATGLTTASAVTEKLVTGGVADGGTLKYAITNTTTQPDDAAFTLTSPTVSDLKTALSMSTLAAGTYYVWYKVFADADHADSEAAYVSVAVAKVITWNSSNINDLRVNGTAESYEKEGITLSANADMVEARWKNYGDPTEDGIEFEMNASGGYTFTAPTGKAFTKIEMTPNGSAGWDIANLGTGWSFSGGPMTEVCTATWKGSAAASKVELLTGADMFGGTKVKSIAFTLVDAE